MTQEMSEDLILTRDMREFKQYTNSAEILPTIQITNCANKNLVQWFADKDIKINSQPRQKGNNLDLAAVSSEVTKQKRPSMLLNSENDSVDEEIQYLRAKHPFGATARDTDALILVSDAHMKSPMPSPFSTPRNTLTQCNFEKNVTVQKLSIEEINQGPLNKTTDKLNDLKNTLRHFRKPPQQQFTPDRPGKMLMTGLQTINSQKEEESGKGTQTIFKSLQEHLEFNSTRDSMLRLEIKREQEQNDWELQVQCEANDALPKITQKDDEVACIIIQPTDQKNDKYMKKTVAKDSRIIADLFKSLRPKKSRKKYVPCLKKKLSTLNAVNER